MQISYDQINPDSDDKLEIDGKTFCKAFKEFGDQVTEETGPVFECKVCETPSRRYVTPLSNKTANLLF